MQKNDQRLEKRFLMLFKRGQVFSSPELDQFFTECLMLIFNIHLFPKIANAGMENIYGPDGLNGPDGQNAEDRRYPKYYWSLFSFETYLLFSRRRPSRPWGPSGPLTAKDPDSSVAIDAAGEYITGE